MKCEFEKINYFHRHYNPHPITKRIEVLGIDSEAYTTGQPFMFCISDGTITTTNNLFEVLFSRQYRGKKFVCYNLKYDEGAILYHLPKTCLDTLRKTGKVSHEGYDYRSIPAKELVISKGHKSIPFYDIAQFYGTSLNKAALYYLGKEKIEVGTKRFSPEYVSKHWHKLAEYCQYDAQLTKELADYFIDILIDEFNIYPQKLYSTGYIAGIHFSRTCDIIDVNRYWHYYRECLEYAYKSYAGGKFEVYKRGYSYFYQYDINSAYPHELSQLQDIRYAKVKSSNKYQKSATYGFIKCRVIVHEDYSPVAIKVYNVNRYPVGSFTCYITKQIYDYLIKQGETIEIIKGWWLWCDGTKPYYDEVHRLYSLKAKLKGGGDKLRYQLVKILLNSFYGKLIQVTTKYRDGKVVYEAGYLFNPMYASMITANTRLRLSDVCTKHPHNAIAVFTDCVITDKDLSGNGLDMSTELGAWDFVREGEGVIVGSGVYQIGDKVHYRGYKTKVDLIDLINNTTKVKIDVPQKDLVLSWRLIAFRNADHKLINRFTSDSKSLNLHFDTKRDWQQKWTRKHILVDSEPYIHVEVPHLCAEVGVKT